MKILSMLITMVMLSGCTMWPPYNVWHKKKEGEAKLAEATSSRLILVEQAKAELEAADMQAKAINIVGEAAKKYPEYRAQMFIQAFGEALQSDKIQKIIYVPTEGNIPLIEAGKR